MSTPKHTPGPWVAALGERLNTDVYHIDKQGNRVFVAEFATQADAVLSTAAPAMYEALQQLTHVEQLRKQAVTENDYVDLVLADSKLQQLAQAVLAQVEGNE